MKKKNASSNKQKYADKVNARHLRHLLLFTSNHNKMDIVNIQI